MGIDQKGYEFVAEIAPVKGDVLLPKKHPSAFFGTPLVSHLIDLGADALFVTGCTTSGCVRSSVSDAFAFNFKVVVPQECVYDRSPTAHAANLRSEEHTSELQSLMRNSYAVFCLKKKKTRH